MAPDPEETQEVDLGGLVFDACGQEDYETAERILRSGMIYVLHQIDESSPDMPDLEDEDAEAEFNVVVAEADGVIAIMCFTALEHVDAFLDSISEELPEDFEIPVVGMDGNTLIDGLPDDMGLLVNAGTELECFFPPGVWAGSEGAEPEDAESEGEEE
ncbi:MAG: hypothetical protein D6753_14840 [Planctomycetota bacterium]|nr:MAG: hypothetical protein D6753_14840 [Planctomycetota bacterium]